MNSAASRFLRPVPARYLRRGILQAYDVIVDGVRIGQVRKVRYTGNRSGWITVPYRNGDYLPSLRGTRTTPQDAARRIA